MKCKVLLVLFCIVDCIHSETYKDRHHLHDDLMYRYDKDVVPNSANGPGVNVTIAVHLLRIIGLDDHVLTLDTYIPIRWQADNLKWRPGHVGGITNISLPNDQLWKPDLALVEGAGQSVFINSENARVNILSDGKVVWGPPMKTQTFCSHEKLHNGDEIECRVSFYSWSHSAAMLDMKLESEEMITDDLDVEFNTHWKLVSTHGVVEHTLYDCCPEPYVKAYYTLRLRYVA